MMAESIFATILSIIIGISTLALGSSSQAPARVGPDASPQHWSLPGLFNKAEREALRDDIRGSVDEYVEQLLNRLKRDAAAQQRSQPQAESKDNLSPGCTRIESSGPGWSRTEVRCHHESSRGGSYSSSTTISSSSVNVTSTNTNDGP
jgi:hypothetical protein